MSVCLNLRNSLRSAMINFRLCLELKTVLALHQRWCRQNGEANFSDDTLLVIVLFRSAKTRKREKLNERRLIWQGTPEIIVPDFER